VEVFADVEQPVDDLLSFAESALRQQRTGLGADADPSRPAYAIYLCRELETIRALEERHGWPRSDPGPFRTFEFRGGFYPGSGMIALRCDPGDDMRWDIAHELAHAVFEEVVGQDCDAINEGLAEYSTARLLARGQGPFRLDGLAAAVERNELPSLQRFFGLSYWEFRDERAHGRNFDLSWLLVRVLLEDDAAGIAGRFPRLLENLRALEPWAALRRTYDVALLEDAWKRRAEVASRWIPVYGEWSQGDGTLEVTLREPGFALLVQRQSPYMNEAFSIRTRPTGLEAGSEVGFVVGFESKEHYVALVLRPSTSSLVVTWRTGGHWDSPTSVPVRCFPRDWESAELELACDAQGEIELSCGRRVLARHALGPAAFHGRPGLFVDPWGASGERHAVFEQTESGLASPLDAPVLLGDGPDRDR